MDKKFYEIKKNRKYASFVDEYRRYYVTGKNFQIKEAKNQNLGHIMFRFCVGQIMKPIWKSKIAKKVDYDNFFENMKLGDSKYKKQIIIAEFKKDQSFSLQYSDSQKNVYRIVLEIKSNQSNTIKYSEWVKKDKPFFGINDTLGKIIMRRSVIKKAKLLKQIVRQKLFGITLKQNKLEKPKINTKGGFIQRRQIGYEDDYAQLFNSSTIAPDRTSNEKDQS